MYRASFHRLSGRVVEVCSLTHSGDLPAPWMATGFVINLVLAGEADLWSRGVTSRVGPGHLVLANPGQLRTVTRRHSTVAATRSISVDEHELSRAVRQRSQGRLQRVGGFRATTSQNVRIRAALATLYATIGDGSSRLGVDSALERLFDLVCSDLLGDAPERWSSHPGVRRARELLEERHADDHSLSDLAASVGLSRAHFIRAFRREVGAPPHQYQIHVRIRRARQLLAEGASVAAAAAATGFFDQAHFARHFRRLVGVRAIDYRGHFPSV